MPNRPALLLLAGLLLAAHASVGRAQERAATTVPWAYSAYFGTGWYEIGEDRDAFALRYVFKRRWQQPRIDAEGERELGLQWRLPVTLGLDEFPLDDPAGSVDPANFASVSFTPGAWLDFPVTERLMLRPFAAGGWATLLNGEDAAWIYWAGAHSRYLLMETRPRLALINSVGFVGYSPRNGPSENFWPLTTALEFRHPLWRIADGREWLQLNWHAAHTHFHGQLDIRRADGTSEQISEQWELGFAFSRSGGRLELGWFSLDRLGLAYRFSGDGELEGIALVIDSLFDR